MQTFTLGKLTLAQLREVVDLHNRGTVPALWAPMEQGELTDEERMLLASLRRRLQSYRTEMANEATIWARVIYPLLVLAERDRLRAYS